MEICLSFLKPVPVCGVDNVDDCVYLVEVVFPETGRLTTDVPKGKCMLTVFNGLNIETYSWYCLFESLITHLKQ